MLNVLGIDVQVTNDVSAWTSPDGTGWELRADGFYSWLSTPFAKGEWVRVAGPQILVVCVAYSIGWARSTEYRATLRRFLGAKNGQ